MTRTDAYSLRRPRYDKDLHRIVRLVGSHDSSIITEVLCDSIKDLDVIVGDDILSLQGDGLAPYSFLRHGQ